MNPPGLDSIDLVQKKKVINLIIWCQLLVLYFGPFLVGSCLSPFSLHPWFVSAIPGLWSCTPYPPSSTHHFTNSLSSGNFQTHFASLPSSPKLQIHKASGEVPQRHQVLELSFFRPSLETERSSRQLPSPPMCTASRHVSRPQLDCANNMMLF